MLVLRLLIAASFKSCSRRVLNCAWPSCGANGATYEGVRPSRYTPSMEHF